MPRLASAIVCVIFISPPRAALNGNEPTPVKLVGSADEVKGLIGKDIAELRQALSAEKPEMKDLKRAKVLALVIGRKGVARRRLRWQARNQLRPLTPRSGLSAAANPAYNSKFRHTLIGNDFPS